MANISNTLHINFYQNRSSIAEAMIKTFGVLTVFLIPRGVCMYRLQVQLSLTGRRKPKFITLYDEWQLSVSIGKCDVGKVSKNDNSVQCN